MELYFLIEYKWNHETSALKQLLSLRSRPIRVDLKD